MSGRIVFCLALIFLLLGCASQPEAPQESTEQNKSINASAEEEPSEAQPGEEYEWEEHTPATPPPEDAECEADRDCPEGKYCYNWYCVQISGSEGGCSSDGECMDGEFCLHGRCIAWQGRPRGPECSLDEECTLNTTYCEEGYCVSFPTEPAGPDCLDDSHCGFMEYCSNSYCLPWEGPVRGYECIGDGDCTGMPCVDGLCLPVEAEAGEDLEEVCPPGTSNNCSIQSEEPAPEEGCKECTGHE